MSIIQTADKLIADAAVVTEGANVMKGQIEVFGQEKFEEGKEAGKVIGWDEAMAQVASNPGGGDPLKIYTEAELNAEIALVKEPLEAEVSVLRNKNDALKESVNNLQSQIDGMSANIDAQVVEKVAEVKAKVNELYSNAQASESDTEAAFKAALESL